MGGISTTLHILSQILKKYKGPACLFYVNQIQSQTSCKKDYPDINMKKYIFGRKMIETKSSETLLDSRVGDLKSSIS